MIGGRVNLSNMIPCFFFTYLYAMWFVQNPEVILLLMFLLRCHTHHQIVNHYLYWSLPQIMSSKVFETFGSSSAPGLKGNMAFRSRERAVAFGSLVGLPIVLDQTSGRQWTPWTTWLWWSSKTMLLYKFYIISWNVNSRTCQLPSSKVSIGFSFITLNT